MLLNSILVLLGHYVASSSTQINLTSPSYTGITVNQPFNLSWTGAVDPVALKLVRERDHNDTLTNITENFSGFYYVWTPPYLPAPTEAPFAFEIIDSTNELAFSPEFNISDNDPAVYTSIPETSSSTSSSTITSSSSTSSSTITSSSSTSSATAVSSSSSSTTGLSTGAKAGIGVGVALGILLIVFLTGVSILFHRRYRATIKSNGNSSSNKPELDGVDRNEERKRERAAEITGVPVNELNAEQIGEPVATVPREPIELE